MIYVSSDWHGCPLDTVLHLFRKTGVAMGLTPMLLRPDDMEEFYV